MGVQRVCQKLAKMGHPGLPEAAFGRPTNSRGACFGDLAWRVRRQQENKGFGDNQVMAARVHTVWIWVAVTVAAGGVAWALYKFAPENSDPPPTGAASASANLRVNSPAPVGGDAAPSVPQGAALAAGDRFKLAGVMLSGPVQIALISVDGRPAQLFRVGDTVDGNTVVREVSERGAALGPRDGSTALALGLSQPPPPTVNVAPPVAPVLAAPADPLAGRAIPSQDPLRKSGSKYLPVAPQVVSPTPKPGEGNVAPVDDGRWRPSGQQ